MPAQLDRRQTWQNIQKQKNVYDKEWLIFLNCKMFSEKTFLSWKIANVPPDEWIMFVENCHLFFWLINCQKIYQWRKTIRDIIFHQNFSQLSWLWMVWSLHVDPRHVSSRCSERQMTRNESSETWMSRHSPLCSASHRHQSSIFTPVLCFSIGLHSREMISAINWIDSWFDYKMCNCALLFYHAVTLNGFLKVTF